MPYLLCRNFGNFTEFKLIFRFGIFSYFSGQTLYDRWIYQLYNTFFTCLPIIWFGIYDKEYKYKELINDKNFYIQGIANKLFHTKRFWKWVLYGMIEGLLIFIICFYCNSSATNRNGENQDLWSIGKFFFTIKF